MKALLCLTHRLPDTLILQEVTEPEEAPGIRLISYYQT